MTYAAKFWTILSLNMYSCLIHIFSVAKIRITKYKKYGYDDAAYMIEVKDILKVNKKIGFKSHIDTKEWKCVIP